MARSRNEGRVTKQCVNKVREMLRNQFVTSSATVMNWQRSNILSGMTRWDPGSIGNFAGSMASNVRINGSTISQALCVLMTMAILSFSGIRRST